MAGDSDRDGTGDRVHRGRRRVAGDGVEGAAPRRGRRRLNCWCVPTLLHQLGSYKPFTAMVVGDFMLDQHVYGAAERLSPDAPVPVLHATKSEDRPGGASNVSLCIRGL